MSNGTHGNIVGLGPLKAVIWHWLSSILIVTKWQNELACRPFKVFSFKNQPKALNPKSTNKLHYKSSQFFYGK